MEALLIRGFVLVLALSGFGASTVSGGTASANTGVSSTLQTTPPNCPVNDPTNCGLD